jgi:hypothetical protein
MLIKFPMSDWSEGCEGDAIAPAETNGQCQLRRQFACRWVSKADVQAAISASSSGASYDSAHPPSPPLLHSRHLNTAVR